MTLLDRIKQLRVGLNGLATELEYNFKNIKTAVGVRNVPNSTICEAEYPHHSDEI